MPTSSFPALAAFGGKGNDHAVQEFVANNFLLNRGENFVLSDEQWGCLDNVNAAATFNRADNQHVGTDRSIDRRVCGVGSERTGYMQLGQIVIEGLVFRDDEFLLGVIAQSL